MKSRARRLSRRRRIEPNLERRTTMSIIGKWISGAVLATSLVALPAVALADGGHAQVMRGERKIARGERLEKRGARVEKRGMNQKQRGERMEQRGAALAATGHPVRGAALERRGA